VLCLPLTLTLHVPRTPAKMVGYVLVVTPSIGVHVPETLLEPDVSLHGALVPPPRVPMAVVVSTMFVMRVTGDVSVLLVGHSPIAP